MSRFETEHGRQPGKMPSHHHTPMPPSVPSSFACLPVSDFSSSRQISMLAAQTPSSCSKRLASRAASEEAAKVELFLTKKAGEKFAAQNGRQPNAEEQQEIRKTLDSSFPLVQVSITCASIHRI